MRQYWDFPNACDDLSCCLLNYCQIQAGEPPAAKQGRPQGTSPRFTCIYIIKNKGEPSVSHTELLVICEVQVLEVLLYCRHSWILP